MLPKEKSSSTSLQSNSRYKRIAVMLKDPVTIVYLEFISAITPHLEAFLRAFQSEGPVIHLMYNRMNLLLRSIMLRFLKEEIIGNREGKSLLEVDPEKYANCWLLKEIDIGEGTRRALLSVKDKEAKESRMAMLSFLIKLSKLLRDALPLSSSFLQDIENLHPAMRTVQCDNSIRRLCIKLKPLELDTDSIDKILFEWRTYKLDPDLDALSSGYGENQRIDEYWGNVFSTKDKISGSPKYENLAILVKNCLSLPHGNADLERGFSLNKSIITNNRTSLSEAAIIGIRNVKDAVKRYGSISAIPVTQKLLLSVTKAHSIYAKVKEEEKEAKRKRAIEDEKNAENSSKKIKRETEDKIKEINKRIKNLKDDQLAAQTCLAEGNSRLQAAISQKDFQGMKIASTMIDAATNKVQQITQELNLENEKKFKLQSNLKV